MVSIPLSYPIHYGCHSSEGKFAEYVFVEKQLYSGPKFARRMEQVSRTPNRNAWPYSLFQALPD